MTALAYPIAALVLVVVALLLAAGGRVDRRPRPKSHAVVREFRRRERRVSAYGVVRGRRGGWR